MLTKKPGASVLPTGKVGEPVYSPGHSSSQTTSPVALPPLWNNNHNPLTPSSLAHSAPLGRPTTTDQQTLKRGAHPPLPARQTPPPTAHDASKAGQELCELRYCTVTTLPAQHHCERWPITGGEGAVAAGSKTDGMKPVPEPRAIFRVGLALRMAYAGASPPVAGERLSAANRHHGKDLIVQRGTPPMAPSPPSQARRLDHHILLLQNQD
ncbi:dual specificity tyrosine-phosphorylation-regulated kinase 2 [Lates japonicus]|uniref:Dual specificity tyrosine-phosphorylation-regulated kinase 2 n=1 Tax=Lates japonicus TaxID=270547 RepID=A0AAD3QYD4_LATJO|nr:dual specificity tyrosine-phosphorylation-regulated kinase 2 [Lates japonicus]